MVTLRERLHEDEAVPGRFVTLDAPAVVGLAGWVGLDFGVPERSGPSIMDFVSSSYRSTCLV